MPINNELKRIEPFYIWQSSDKVTGYYLARAIRDLVGLQGAMWFGVLVFTTMTSVAGIHIVLDKLAHARPLVVTSNQLHCLGLAWMSCWWEVMVDTYNLSTQCIILGDINLAVIEE